MLNFDSAELARRDGVLEFVRRALGRGSCDGEFQVGGESGDDSREAQRNFLDRAEERHHVVGERGGVGFGRGDVKHFGLLRRRWSRRCWSCHC